MATLNSTAIAPAPLHRVTARSLVVGGVLSLACGLFIPYLDHFIGGTFLGGQHLPPGAVFALMLLVLVVNPLLARISPRAAFSRSELLVIYAMLLFSLLIPDHGSESVFVPVSVTPYYYATAANGWDKLFFQYIPDWFHPARGLAIKNFFESLPPGSSLPWAQWLVPLLAWGSLTLVLYLLASLVSVLLFPQWSHDEKLAFPLVVLPLEMTGISRTYGGTNFWANWIMWAGFGVALIFQGLQGLHMYYPSIPGSNGYFDMANWFKSGPLMDLGWTPGLLLPSVIGVSVLLRTDVTFSVIGFFWFSRAQKVIASAFGYRNLGGNISGFPLWLGGQPWGGYLAYLLIGLWTARPRLIQAWREFIGEAKPQEEQAVSYRICVAGILLCLIFATAWLATAGMSLWSAVFVVLMYLMIIIILSKVVAEVGLLFVQQTITPAQALNYYFGTDLVGARSLTVGMFFDRAFADDLRSTIAPSFFQGMRIAELGGVDQKQMLKSFWVAILCSLPLALLGGLWTFYHRGAVNCNSWFAKDSGNSGWDPLAGWLTRPRGADPSVIIASIVGAAAVTAISAMRRQYLWFWPHPVGFIMMQSYPVTAMWFSMLIAVSIKSVVLRYGGPRVLHQVTPFFLGLAFGDAFTIALFKFISVILGTHGLLLGVG